MLLAVPGSEGSNNYSQWEEYEQGFSKSKDNSIDVVIRDFQNLVLNLKYENASDTTYNYLTSDFSIIDNGIKFTDIKKKIAKEF